MMRRSSVNSLRRHTLPLLLLLLIGCGNNSTEPPEEIQLPPEDPARRAIGQLVASFESKDLGLYQALFTEDFIFEFSNSADPELVARYASGWFKEDELLSAGHLFQGFTDGSGTFQPAATSIDVLLAPTTPQPDQTVGVDSAKYRVLLTTVLGNVNVPPRPGEVEPTTYVFDSNVHRIFLVRGDVAQLSTGQPADSTRWYIYRWRDETVLAAARNHDEKAILRSTMPSTWGRLKAVYR